MFATFGMWAYEVADPEPSGKKKILGFVLGLPQRSMEVDWGPELVSGEGAVLGGCCGVWGALLRPRTSLSSDKLRQSIRAVVGMSISRVSASVLAMVRARRESTPRLLNGAVVVISLIDAPVSDAMVERTKSMIEESGVGSVTPVEYPDMVSLEEGVMIAGEPVKEAR